MTRFTQIFLPLLIVLLFATWVRLWQFPDIPPGFRYDEAHNAVDALWLWEAGGYIAYLPGNQGRGSLFHYLAAGMMAWLGPSLFSFRFVSVVAGLLTLPLLYCWAVTMFAVERQRQMIGLIACVGLALSFWHIALSRTGFRASLVPLFWVLIAYLFWRGWHKGSIWSMIGAGLALGLSQSTYLPARLFPLPFGLFIVGWTLVWICQSPYTAVKSYPLWRVWLWLGVMALASFIVFIPLGLIFWENPTTLLNYAGQASIAYKIAAGEQTWPNHLFDALRIVFDIPLAIWQGKFEDWSHFDWLTWLGFWLGFLVSLKRCQKAPYAFLLMSFVIMGLPAALGDMDFSGLRLPALLPVHQAVGSVRLSALLPTYYLFVSLGLLNGLDWLYQGFHARWFKRDWKRNSLRSTFPLPFSSWKVRGALITLLIFSICLNSFNFLGPWPRQPLLYEEYHGPTADLIQYLLTQTENKDIILPFYLYAHPVARFYFDPLYTETDQVPELNPRETVLVITSHTPRTAYAWLTQGVGQGLAYVTPSLNEEAFSLNQTTEPVAFNLRFPWVTTAQLHHFKAYHPLAEVSLSQKLNREVLSQTQSFQWSDVALAGYDLSSRRAKTGQGIYLTLYWRNLVDQPKRHHIFIHLVNGQGEGVGQLDGLRLSDGHRWRKGKLTPTEHHFYLDDTFSLGPYFIRLGLFENRADQRLLVSNETGSYQGDHIPLGLFYLNQQDKIARQPSQTRPAKLGDGLELLGYHLPNVRDQKVILRQAAETPLQIDLYWQATQALDDNYTIFVQWLDSQNQLITSRDSQPLHGHYPTAVWSKGEIIIEQVSLTLPPTLETGSYRLVTGMYNWQTGERLIARDEFGQPYSDRMITLFNATVSEDIILLGP